jgi:molybdopterin synthase catalytic subunit
MATEFLISGPITYQDIIDLMEKMTGNTDTGGHSIFIGQVRADITGNKRVIAIEYSAYEAMVRIEAEKIKETIYSEFENAEFIGIIHSTGIVKAGEISLAVLVSARHRHQAISACSKTVELIKERLPVWKKEIFDDGTGEWKQNA